MAFISRQEEDEAVAQLEKAYAVAHRMQDAMQAVLEGINDAADAGETIPSQVRDGMAKANEIMRSR